METEKITPFAIALAEAMTARAAWLGKVKQARWKSHTITHDDYTTIYGAYIKSKKRTRDAVSEYQRAKNEIRDGRTPDLKPEWREWLAMQGVNA